MKNNIIIYSECGAILKAARIEDMMELKNSIKEKEKINENRDHLMILDDSIYYMLADGTLEHVIIGIYDTDEFLERILDHLDMIL